jgi:hypothetical protein
MAASPTNMDGYFKIISRFKDTSAINKKDTKLCIDINGGMSDPGTKVIVYKAHHGLHQLWKFADGIIINVVVGFVLDIADGDVVINPKQTPAPLSQKWTIDNIGRIKSNATNQYLTLDQKTQTALFLSQELQSITQQWYFDRVVLTQKQQDQIKNALLRKKTDDLDKKMDEYRKKHGIHNNVVYTPEELAKRAEDIKQCAVNCANSVDMKTLKIPQSNKTIFIPNEKIPKFSGNISLQAWIKIKSFVATSEYKPIYYISNVMGLWLYPQIFKLFVHYDLNITAQLQLNEWFNIVQIYTPNNLKIYLNNTVILNTRIDKWTEQKFNLTIINDPDIIVGTTYISNFVIDDATISERYNNDIYNTANNPYYLEYTKLKQQYDKLLSSNDLLKYSKCPPAEKCVPGVDYMPESDTIRINKKEYDRLIALSGYLKKCEEKKMPKTIIKYVSNPNPNDSAGANPNDIAGANNGGNNGGNNCPPIKIPQPICPTQPPPICPTQPPPICPKQSPPICPKPVCPNIVIPKCPAFDNSSFDVLKTQYAELLKQLSAERKSAVNKFAEANSGAVNNAIASTTQNIEEIHKAEINKIKSNYDAKLYSVNSKLKSAQQEITRLANSLKLCNSNFI